MNNITKKKIIFLTFILLIFWVVLIFLMSSNTGIESISLSSQITDYIKSHNLERLIPTIIKGASLELNVRKLAHILEYCILELLICFLLYQVLRSLFSRKTRFLISISISVILSFQYSVLDEYHQTLVSGRTGQVSDIIIDSYGIVYGAILAIFIFICMFMVKKIKGWKS